MPELINREADQRVRTNDTDLSGNTGSVVQEKSHPAVPVQFVTATKVEKPEEEKEQSTKISNDHLMLDNLAQGPPDSRKSSMTDVASPIQTKGELSHPSVPPVQLQTPTTAHRSLAAPAFQFKSDLEESQAEMAPESEGKLRAAPIQTKPAGQNGLPADLNSKLQGTFNSDFSDVKIHQDAQSATDVGALAYTQGNDVHFAPGQYDPNSSKGQELIGHELTHVVQQRQGRVQTTTQAKGLPVNDDPGLEAEADEMGRAVVQRKGAGLENDRSTISYSNSQVIQRDGAPSKPSEAKSDMKFTYGLPKLNLLKNPKSWGYITGKELKVGGEISLDFSHGDTAVKEYFVEHDSKGELRAGFKHESELLHKSYCEKNDGSTLDLRAKISQSKTTSSGDIGIVVESDFFGAGATSLRFVLFGYDGEDIDVAAVTFSGNVAPIGICRIIDQQSVTNKELDLQKKFNLPIRPQIDLKLGFDFKVEPNKSEILKDAMKRVAPLIAADVLITGSLVAGVAFSIFGLIESFNIADDIPKYTNEYAKHLAEFSNNFNAAMKGKPRTGLGANEANAALQKIALETGMPIALVLKNSQNQDYYYDAVSRISPKLKEMTLENWKKTHLFDTYLNFGKGAKTLARTFDGLNGLTALLKEKV